MVLSEKDKAAVAKMLSVLSNEVHILFFKSNEPSCKYCNIIEELLADIHSAQPKVIYEVHDVGDEIAKHYGVEHGPTMLFQEKPNIVWMGTPSGHEFKTFLDDIIAIGTNSIDLSVNAARKIAKVDSPLDVLVFVTPTCPYCPQAVRTAHAFAFVNKNIRGVMIEALEYNDLANKYNVSAVPKIVVRDPETKKTLYEWEGAIPEDVFADYLLRALARKEGE